MRNADYARLADLINDRFDDLKGLIMATQADIDAITAQLTALAATLTTDVAGIQTEVGRLDAQIAAGGAVNVTALTAAVAGLATTADSVTALVPPATPVA